MPDARGTACCRPPRPPAGEPQLRLRPAQIGATFLFTATAPDDAWATSTLVLLQSVTLCVALWTSGLARAGSW